MNTRLIISVLALLALPVLAKDEVTLQDRLPAGSATLFVLDVPVGEVQIEAYEGTDIEYRVKVREADGGWFSSFDRDDVEVRQSSSSDRIKLEVDLEDTEQEWHVKVPSHLNLILELGVGEMNIENASRDLDVEVGVGSIDVSLAGKDYRRIELEAGVGEADLKGFTNYSSDRAIVSEEVSWRGEGHYEIKAKVGVGEVEVRGR
ncbi:hypothetical protein [Bowmanella dokdonensis]|uniref:Adhesin domain-containing protein n=1 Tax=Bowmanella dokdonensis TaxID=751969 RepID=A0A939DKD0_9ALTE|nr:hypothetical protein [Bowmanella dokdonensis]MBN7824242.1 hypothetical protein [Bowmanella dokdonensis]